MKYKGFYVKITPDTDLHREDKDGNDIRCEGFTIEVFADESEKLEIDVFSVAVDFELLKDSLEEAEQFAMDYIDCEVNNLSLEETNEFIHGGNLQNDLLKMLETVMLDRYGIIRDFIYKRDENGELFFGIPQRNGVIEIYLITSSEELYEYLLEQAAGALLNFIPRDMR